jgi:hypothetical protein
MSTDDDVVGTTTHSEGGNFIEWSKPTGVYPVELVDLRSVVSKQYNNDQLQWEFAPVGYDGPGTLRWWTSTSDHEKSKYPGTCVALGRAMPPVGAKIRRGDFVGRRCLAVIEQVPGKKDAAKKFPRITKLLPDPELANGATDDDALPPSLFDDAGFPEAEE